MLGAPPDSPVQKAFKWLAAFFSNYPNPDIGTDRARDCGALVALHMLHLFKGCGLLNGNGFHSSAVGLLRAMEDALDCFAAIILVVGRAEDWEWAS